MPKWSGNTCSNCGRENSPEHKFCMHCGAGLHPGTPEPKSNESEPSMTRSTRVELLRLTIALLAALVITVIWLAAWLRPRDVSEPEAQFWQAVIGIVAITIDIVVVAYVAWRLRRRRDRFPLVRRQVNVADNSTNVHMTAGENSTQISGDVHNSPIYGPLFLVSGSTWVTIVTLLTVLVAVMGLIIALIFLVSKLPDIVAAAQSPALSTPAVPPTALALAQPDTTQTVQPVLSPAPTAIGSLVLTETPTIDVPATAQALAVLYTAQTAAALPTATPTPTVTDMPSPTPSTAGTASSVFTATFTRLPPTATATVAPPTATVAPPTRAPTPTVDLQATAQALARLYATQTAQAAPTSTPQPPTATPARPRATSTPVPPARTYTAPQLTAPASGSAFESGQAVTLRWNSVGTLAPGDHYLLAVQHLGGSEWRVTDDLSWSLPEWMACPPLPEGCTWWVAVVRGAEVGGYSQAPGQVVSADSAIWRFGWLQPSGGEPQPPGGGEPPSPTPPLVITPDS